MDMADEPTIHAVLADGSRLVRYPDGVWGRQWPERSMVPWQRLKLPMVVTLATTAPTVVYGQPGGSVFDRRVRAAREGVGKAG